ncbi:MAG: radical SAM protein [archaeon]|nr:radical SAM protein [archaeon]
MNIKKLDCGSARSGPLANGCKYCMKGSKMVLFITGKCKTSCYYCPISFEKKGKDVIYANELKISDMSEILEEAESMNAEGTGITGGDPLFDVSRTTAAIKLLKDFFGRGHHIHLYTSTIDPEKVGELVNAGLDEIRFHPPLYQWEKINCSTLKEIVEMNVDVGIEVPALPDHEKELSTLLSYASEIDVKFVNLNELEFSESNWNMMSSCNYDIKNEISAAVNGSEETALRMMEKHSSISIHYCSSCFKDSVQLRKRLIRKANRIAKKYDVVTEDGTILKGYACPRNLEDATLFLINECNVPGELIFIDKKNNRLEIAPWILEDIANDLPFECYISEQYPTADELEVERIPLN